MGARYRVYIEDLRTPSGYSYYYYQVLNRKLIYDTYLFSEEGSASGDVDSHLIFDPILEMEANQAGSFECDIPPTNIGYADIENSLLKYIDIYRNDDLIWQGRIVEVEVDFELNKHIYAEGQLAYFNDMQISLNWADYQTEDEDTGGVYYSVKDLFTAIMDRARERDWNGKGCSTFMVWSDPDLAALNNSTYTLSDDTNDIIYTSVYDALMTNLLEGVLAPHEGRRFIEMNNVCSDENNLIFYRYVTLTVVDEYNYETESGSIIPAYYYFGALTSYIVQDIEYGKNITDMTITYSVDDPFSMITAYGYETKGWWIFATTNRISVTVENEELVEKFGYIEKTVSIDGTTTTTSRLKSFAETQLEEQLKTTMDSLEINVKAIDLTFTGEEDDDKYFTLLQLTHIISEPHGIDTYLPLTKMTLHLDDPSQDEYTFGMNTKSSTQLQAKNKLRTDKSYEISRVTKDYVVDANS